MSIVEMNAHQADISPTMLTQQNGRWIHQVSAALTAFQHEVKFHNGDNAFDTPEVFSN